MSTYSEILDKFFKYATDYGVTCHSTPSDAIFYTLRLMFISPGIEYCYFFWFSREITSQPTDLVKFPDFTINTEIYLEPIAYSQH